MRGNTTRNHLSALNITTSLKLKPFLSLEEEILLKRVTTHLDEQNGLAPDKSGLQTSTCSELSIADDFPGLCCFNKDNGSIVIGRVN